MDRFTTTSAEKALTLAFDKAATAETKVFHPYRYFIAAGETLAQIETVIADVKKVPAAYVALAAKAGAKSYNGDEFVFDFVGDEMTALTGKERVDFQLQGGNGHEPFQCKRIPRIPDFIVTASRAYGQFHPDVATTFGRELRDAAMAVKELSQPSVRFARWLGADGVDVPENPMQPYANKVKRSAAVTKIGNDWVVAVPVSIKADGAGFAEEWAVPPGAKPIAVSEYFGLLEKNNFIQNMPQAPKI